MHTHMCTRKHPGIFTHHTYTYHCIQLVLPISNMHVWTSIRASASYWRPHTPKEMSLPHLAAINYNKLFG